MEGAHDASSKMIEELLKKHGWISREKQFFGKPGTIYDFSARNPAQAKEELESRRAEQDKYVWRLPFMHRLFLLHRQSFFQRFWFKLIDRTEKEVNKTAMLAFQKAEGDYNELMKKKSIIEVRPNVCSGDEMAWMRWTSNCMCCPQNDKQKIQSVIRELDEKKKEALEVTWQKVNK